MDAQFGSPRLTKGALSVIDPIDGQTVKYVIAFQYNPHECSRSLQPQTTSEGGAKVEVQHLKGAPIETLKFNEVYIDAIDKLEQVDQQALESGIYPQLSALEMLVYPTTKQVQDNVALLNQGVLEVASLTAPFLLLVWGKNRVQPVRITEFSITEETYDVHLNPIRAKLSLGFQVLSYNDFSASHPGHNIFITQQRRQEQFVRQANLPKSVDAATENVSPRFVKAADTS